MRRTRRKKSKLFSLILFIIFIFSIFLIGTSQFRVVKIKKANSNLAQEIENIKNSNKKLTESNEKLLTSIKESKDLYDKKREKLKIAYLTFDDGPSNNTVSILKTLKKYNVKATFFVNGHESLSDLYKKISDDGHTLANHTYSHDYKNVYSSVDNFKKDVKKLDDFLTKVTGKKPNHILRYPGGSNNTISYNYGGRTIMKSIIDQMNTEGYSYFDWNVDSTDASTYRQDKDKIVNSVLNQSKYTNKAVILMHDLNPKTTTVQALPEIIEGLQSQGFIFEALSKDSPKTHF